MKNRIYLIISLFLIIMISGCVSSKPTNFYILTPVENTLDKDIGIDPGIIIGIGPVSVAKYIDRPQIIRRLNNNQISFSEFHHWAENIEYNLKRVIGENISKICRTENVELFPWPVRKRIDYQITFFVDRFEETEDGNAILSAMVNIISGKDKKELLKFRFEKSLKADKNDYSSVVSSLSLALFELSLKVSHEIKKIESGRI